MKATDKKKAGNKSEKVKRPPTIPTWTGERSKRESREAAQEQAADAFEAALLISSRFTCETFSPGENDVQQQG